MKHYIYDSWLKAMLIDIGAITMMIDGNRRYHLLQDFKTNQIPHLEREIKQYKECSTRGMDLYTLINDMSQEVVYHELIHMMKHLNDYINECDARYLKLKTIHNDFQVQEKKVVT